MLFCWSTMSCKSFQSRKKKFIRPTQIVLQRSIRPNVSTAIIHICHLVVIGDITTSKYIPPRFDTRPWFSCSQIFFFLIVSRIYPVSPLWDVFRVCLKKEKEKLIKWPFRVQPARRHVCSSKSGNKTRIVNKPDQMKKSRAFGLLSYTLLTNSRGAYWSDIGELQWCT